MKKLSAVFEFGKIVLLVFVTAIIIRYFIFQPFVVEGASMEPSYSTNEYILIDKLSYRFHEPRRGDVIVFKYPNNTQINYIKRVVGLPGEEIKIEKGYVFVNGTKLDESYLAEGTQTYVGSVSQDGSYLIKLKAGEFFVMGDNRNHSSDSREWGALKQSFVTGKSVFVLYKNSTKTGTSTVNTLP